MWKWLLPLAVVLFVVSGTAFAVGAQAYGWAALAFVVAACLGFSGSAVGRPPKPSSAPLPPAAEIKQYRRDHPGTGIGEAIDALRGS